MPKVSGFMLMLLAILLVPRASAFVDDCHPNQLYDAQRRVCLDRCGRDNELTCRVENFCSSNQIWSKHFDPPFCLNRCIQSCDTPRYCNHDIAECRPCDNICDGSDMDACQAYCYDVFVTLPTATPQSPWETCNSNQYYDFDRKLCLDRCGADNEEKCGVDQYCSTTVTWGVKIYPPACLNHCTQPCDGATYCDSISHQCLPCVDLCNDSKTDLCQIYCFDVFMNTTSLEVQTTEDSALITLVNNPVLSTDITTSVTVYQMIVGVRSAAIVVIFGVLAVILYTQRLTRNAYSNIQGANSHGGSKTVCRARKYPSNGHHV